MDLTDVEREVLRHLGATEDGALNFGARLAWRVAHQRARHRLTELGLAHPLGGTHVDGEHRLLTEAGRALLDRLGA